VRIGVVSDTHDNLKNVDRIVDLLNETCVERVVHTGDITQAKTLDVFSRLEAPLFGVFGNNDRERDSLGSAMDRHGFRFEEGPLELCWAERRIVVVHDPREFERVPLDRFHVALHGHTHLHVRERREGALVFNPGECAGHLDGHNVVGVVDLQHLEVELLQF